MPSKTKVAKKRSPTDSYGSIQRNYGFIKQRVKDLTTIDLDNYKTRQMQRRLKALFSRSGYPSWSQYFHHLETDSVALRSFKSYLTINVSKFLRDKHKWTYLADNILPALLKERGRLRIWSAGCSHGAEAYTLAMILGELQNGVGGHYILATDIDLDMLSRAKRGGPYSSEDVEDLGQARLDKYFDIRDGAYWVRAPLRSKIKFRRHDLLNDPFENRFDLVVCRNVVIYFIDETKKELYRRFAASLRNGGILFVGATEIVPSVPGLPLHSVAISFYRKGE